MSGLGGGRHGFGGDNYSRHSGSHSSMGGVDGLQVGGFGAFPFLFNFLSVIARCISVLSDCPRVDTLTLN